MKRKVIQIATAVPAYKDEPEYIYALCDDGTMWWLPGLITDDWQQIPDVPQSGTASELKAQARQHTLQTMRSNA